MKNLAPAILVCLLMLASCSSDGGCEGNCENGYGSYSWADSYEGEWKNGQRNGQGTMNWSDQTQYIGEWKQDKRSGQGTYIYGEGEWEGDKYVGQWENDLFNGQGTYTYADGSIGHSGLWIDGAPAE